MKLTSNFVIYCIAMCFFFSISATKFASHIYSFFSSANFFFFFIFLFPFSKTQFYYRHCCRPSLSLSLSSLSVLLRSPYEMLKNFQNYYLRSNKQAASKQTIYIYLWLYIALNMDVSIKLNSIELSSLSNLVVCTSVGFVIIIIVIITMCDQYACSNTYVLVVSFYFWFFVFRFPFRCVSRVSFALPQSF